jgi:WD40 repeat protein
VQLVRVPTGEIAAELKPHRDAVESLAFRADGQLLATGSKDNSVRLWRRQADSFSELITLSAPGPVTWLSFTPDGKSLAMLIQDEYAVRIWRLDRLQQRLGELGLGW